MAFIENGAFCIDLVKNVDNLKDHQSICLSTQTGLKKKTAILKDTLAQEYSNEREINSTKYSTKSALLHDAKQKYHLK